MGHVTGRYNTASWDAVLSLVIEKDISLKGRKEFRLLQSAQEQAFI